MKMIRLITLAFISLSLTFTLLPSCGNKSDVSPEKESSYKGTAVDLGLSIQWGSCNFGASAPEKVGKYCSFYNAEKALTGNWRLPNAVECEELINSCTWEDSVLNGINGYKITGPNGASIFLPCLSSDSGSYWTSTPEQDGVVYMFFYYQCYENSKGISRPVARSREFVVRPVYD